MSLNSVLALIFSIGTSRDVIELAPGPVFLNGRSSIYILYIFVETSRCLEAIRPTPSHTMGLNTETSAALVFLILYAILFFPLLLGYVTGRLRLSSPYTIIIFHVMVRLASQATGLAFGLVGYSATKLLVAYFILYVHQFKVFHDMLIRPIEVPRATSLSFCAPTASLYRGKTITVSRITHGSNRGTLQGRHCSRDSSIHFPFSPNQFAQWQSYITCSSEPMPLSLPVVLCSREVTAMSWIFMRPCPEPRP